MGESSSPEPVGGAAPPSLLAWCLGSLLVVVVTWLTTSRLDDQGLRGYDGGRYLAMVERADAAPLTPEIIERASQPGAYLSMEEREQHALLIHLPPFCWRVLTPFVASLLPFSAATSMKVLAFPCAWLTLVLLCLWMRSSGLSARATTAGMLLYSGSFWTVKFGFYHPSYVDFMTQPFIVGTLLALARDRYRWLPLVIALGVLQKESLLYLAPVVVLHRAVKHGWRDRGFVLVATTTVGLPLLARWAILESITPLSSHSSTEAWAFHFGRQFFDPEFWVRFLMAAMAALGVMLPALFLGLRSSVRYLVRAPHLGLTFVLGLGLLWGGSDKSRLFLYLLPLWSLLVARLAEPHLERPNATVKAWLVATGIAHLFIGHLWLELDLEGYRSLFSPSHTRLDWVVDRIWIAGALLLWWSAITLIGRRHHSISIRRPSAAET